MSTTAVVLASRRLRVAAPPVLVVAVLAMMVLPLPPLALDALFTFNIAFSIVVLLVAIHTLRPLDFAIFPTLLLLTTLLRLSLNVASTRIVLLEGHTGPQAAGRVIEAFGHFLVGGSYLVGAVVFAILVIINFVVITKGAGRIAEVSARFTLDALPGKQMAIDADLNAGLIGEEEARRRRREIALEADFYGAMDGASKFVRGDAVAGIVITLINVVGGLLVGVLQHGMEVETAARNYVLLTIGDGLVAQIPALVVSTAAGVLVTRVASERDMTDQFCEQLLAQPRLIATAAVILGLLGLVPGMPHAAFLSLAAILGGTAHASARARASVPAPSPAEAVPRERDVGWEDVAPVDVLALEVGYGLIPLVDPAREGELLARIRGIRRRFAQQIGFLPPTVHVRDNLELRPNAYRILLKGVEVGTGEVYPGRFLAIDPGRVSAVLEGERTRDPAFGLPALWIAAADRERAQLAGYTVADAASVVATHLHHLVHANAHELLGRLETQQLLDHAARLLPRAVEELVPKVLPLATVQRVLQLLLEEGVHLRDLRTIVETLAEHGPRTGDAFELAAQVRIALGRSIVQALFPGTSELEVIGLAPELERVLGAAAQSGSEAGAGIEPGLAEVLLEQLEQAARELEARGLPAVLLVPATLRWLLWRMVRRALPQVRVLAHAEVPESRRVRFCKLLGVKP